VVISPARGTCSNPSASGRASNGPWSFANLGVLVALVVGFLGQYILSRSAVARQEVAAGS
jgi:hypothetical protein